ncbi:MAG: multiple sugar transport system permease protein [Pseudonocardiales bacterium]|jgi:multiple sugar transport system permease protein|nr:acbG [Pseudonocardiales bacterium]MDT4908655.1 multiple sugar transport system permease protein [Pseudonocardiales bacterium]MDT4958468.1 multiple sugar transport system permease protein [Pseudonocardiales bacterium]MDT4972435.1 multiple sugar transport system permease protein [Pseudonocardiales bacterium]
MAVITPAVAVSTAETRPARRKRPKPSVGSVAAQVFMIIMSALWVLPILFALYVSLRPVGETNRLGYVSLAHSLTLRNFVDAWNQSEMWRFFLNSLRVTVPAVLITLMLASAVAFVVSKMSSRWNIALLILFTAGNLLPQQVLITPLYRMYLAIHLPHFVSSSGLLYDSYVGLIVINVSFQLGFCVFVLSNYMKTIPGEIDEAAIVDGASLWARYWRLTLPLCRPAMAALATLLTTWIYNDFFWAITLISTGNKRPITSALANLQGQFVSNQNMISAAALMAAVPTLGVYVMLQKQFIAGLALGSSKG